MGLQVLVEGARWQLFPAYVVAAIVGAALVFRRSAAPAAGGKAFRAVRVGLAVTALSVAVLLPALLPVPSFPSPEGPHPVGTVRFLLQDPAREDAGEPGRGRRLMAQAWYPAAASAASAPRARYMPDARVTGPALSRLFGLPPFFVNHLAYSLSHSHENVPFAPSVGRAPLLIFSHGHRFAHSLSTTSVEALASQGYVVVALEHTYDAAAVVFPDGAVALTRALAPNAGTDEEAASSKTFWIGVRAADVRFVLDTLAGATGAPMPDVLVGHIDAARVGVFGHSLGGGTAAEVCRTDARVVACADIEGLIYGEAQVTGVAQPFLLVEAEAREHALDAFAARLRGPSCRVRVAHAAHLDFTDVPRLSPLLQYLSSRGETSEGAADTVGETNQVVTAFFDATLRGDEAGWSRVRSARPRFSTACERLPVP
jgi:predicted dienelactone hydrolase